MFSILFHLQWEKTHHTAMADSASHCSEIYMENIGHPSRLCNKVFLSSPIIFPSLFHLLARSLTRSFVRSFVLFVVLYADWISIQLLLRSRELIIEHTWNFACQRNDPRDLVISHALLTCQIRLSWKKSTYNFIVPFTFNSISILVRCAVDAMDFIVCATIMLEHTSAIKRLQQQTIFTKY